MNAKPIIVTNDNAQSFSNYERIYHRKVKSTPDANYGTWNDIIRPKPNLHHKRLEDDLSSWGDLMFGLMCSRDSDWSVIDPHRDMEINWWKLAIRALDRQHRKHHVSNQKAISAI